MTRTLFKIWDVAASSGSVLMSDRRAVPFTKRTQLWKCDFVRYQDYMTAPHPPLTYVYV